MPPETRFISERIDRPAADVYDYAADPANLPEWAPGLGDGVENVDGRWFVHTPVGRVGSNRMRVVAHGDGAEMDAGFDHDAALGQADLTRLKQVLEADADPV
jgi:hypothetical protein